MPRLLRRIAIWSAIAISAAGVGIAVVEFPYDTDVPISAQEAEKERSYYADAYKQASPTGEQAPSAYDTRYIQIATAAAEDSHVDRQVTDLVNRYGLRTQRILEIGSGRGYLQDMADDYTGLDISPNVGRFYHKKFVLGSATALPFPDNSFDAGWSVWVFEHIPNPEQALLEWRRVTRDGGLILLYPAWSATAWPQAGYRVRPYSDFGLVGKLMKASTPIRFSTPFLAAAKVPGRFVRSVASYLGGPTRLHYTRLSPNYKEYWEADSDAVNSLDRHEVMLWFRSRGDECLNCEGVSGSILMRSDPWLIIRVHKKAG
jgi:SAM-dependent methyltransferase